MIEEILDKKNIGRALWRVRANHGAAGVDGFQIVDLDKYLLAHWHETADLIREGRYKPRAVLGVEIPKPKGGKRLLGIPTVVDRVIQQAIHQVLSPMFDPEFSDSSHGFRPQRSAHGAIKEAGGYVNSGRTKVLSMDMAKFFDRVDHDLLMREVMCKVEDKALLKLIREYLQAPMVIAGRKVKRTRGTPQGGPLSPLLSNILLNRLDKELEKRGHTFVRYADDCTVYLKSKRAAHRVRRSLTRYLEHVLRLEVNQEKTKVSSPAESVLLGYRFLSTYRKKGEYAPNLTTASLSRLKEKIKRLTRKTIPMSFAERSIRLNRLVRGWVQYFKLAGMASALKKLDGWVRNRLRYCIWHHWKKPERKRKNLIRLGIPEGQAYAWSRTRMGGWPVACSPILRTTITAARMQQRGYLSFHDYFLSVR